VPASFFDSRLDLSLKTHAKVTRQSAAAAIFCFIPQFWGHYGHGRDVGFFTLIFQNRFELMTLYLDLSSSLGLRNDNFLLYSFLLSILAMLTDIAPFFGEMLTG
jgi:hypothetical protein